MKRAAHPTLGAEVQIDLQDPATFTEDIGRLLRDTLVTHGVLNIRTGDAPLDVETFKRVCSLLGPIKSFTADSVDGAPLRYGPDMQIVDADLTPAERTQGRKEKDGEMENQDIIHGRPPPTGKNEKHRGSWEFHTDDSFMLLPGRFTCLHPQELPRSGGGDTGFLDMREAWNELPDELQSEVGKMVAVHHYNNHNLFTDIAGNALNGLPGNDLPEAAHPIVRIVPETGAKALYLNLNRMRGVVGLETDAAKELLIKLQKHAEAASVEHRHMWRHGDILVWDNAQVQHHAHDDFPLGEPRRMIRFMVGQEQPIGKPGVGGPRSC